MKKKIKFCNLSNVPAYINKRNNPLLYNIFLPSKDFEIVFIKKMTNEIQRIISGKSQIRHGANICAAISYLADSAKSSSLDKTNKYFKREETERLKKYILEDLHDENGLTSN